MVLGRLATLVGIRASAQTTGEIAANVQLDVSIAHQQRLRVSVHGNELDAPKSGLDHPVDCVDAAAADAHDLDNRQVVL
jgi:hypothetical protein